MDVHSSAAVRVLKFGAFEADLHTRELRRQGMQIKLQEQPFQILESLLEHPGEIVTREQLRQKLWPADTFVDVDNSVNAAVNRLREALGDSAESPRFVETVPRRGYRFVAPVTVVSTQEREIASEYEFGPFRLRLADGMLFRDGERVALPPKVIEVLILLVQAQGKPVPKEELLRKVWADAIVEEGTLASHISILSKALGEGRDSRVFIEAIAKRGYRFVAPVKIAADGSAPPATDGSAPGPSLTARKRVHLLVASALTLTVAAAAVWGWLRWRETSSASPIHVVAVLPLMNLSGDPSQEYFSDGLTDELITSLAKISSLRVVSRTSAMHYKSVQKRLPEIARELNVDAIVEGTVSRSGGRIRITAQLIDARTDRHLWAEDYDRPVGDAVTLQNQIARAVAGEIRAKLTTQEHVQLSQERPVNPVAYEAYLKGRFHWNKRTESDLKAGIDYFNRSIEADPQYALAYVGLADSYNILGSWVFTALPAGEARKMALLYVNKALAIDDRLGEAHTSLANAKVLFDWDWEGGEAEFKRAIELNPNYALAYHWYGELLLNLGRFDESIRQSHKAKELDPLSPAITFALARRLAYAGRAEPALKEAAIALELEPNLPLAHTTLGNAYAQQRRFPEAIAEFEKAVRFSNSNPNFIADLGYAYAVAGERAHAGKILNRLKEISRTRYVAPYQLAAVYAGLGENRKALQELQRAYDERSPWMINLRVDPRFQHLRAEPEFVRLLKALQFPAT